MTTMTVSSAALATLAYFIAKGGNWMVGQCMSERPIVAGAICGLLLGDLKTGVIMGASLEAIFMGVVNIGGAMAAEPTSATILAVAFTIVLGVDQGASLTLAVPIGVLGVYINTLVRVLTNSAAPIVDSLAAKGNDKGLVTLHFALFVFRWSILSMIVFFGVLAGAPAVEALITRIPDKLMAGLNAAAGFMPAVGFAILMKMLWDKKLSIYYFLGFVLVIYLGLPLVAVATIGVVIAVTTAIRDMQLVDAQGKMEATVGGNQGEEEEFFNE